MDGSETGTETQAAAGGATRRNRLSGRALAALYLAVCTMPLGLALLAGAAPADRWERAAAALGIAALAAMAVQFVTSGRFETFSGRLGIDRIMAFHKIAARWVLLAVLLHPPLYVLPTFLDDPQRGIDRMLAYAASPRFATGGLAWLMVFLLVLAAVLRERLPARYETWRASHLLIGLAAVGLGLHHAVSVGRFSAAGPVFWYWAAVAAGVVAAVAVLYGWRWARLHGRPWRLASVTRRAGRMWELDIQPAPGTPELDYHAGQFVWMTEGSRRFPLYDHPFSIADSPRRPGISLIVKELGDFTNAIGQLRPGTPIGLDGPHGDFVLEGRAADAVVLVAGGVGIAPVMGLLRDLVARGDPRPVRLAYAAGAPDKFACRDEIAAAAGTLDLGTMLIAEEGGPGWTGETGRLDRARLELLIEGLDPARTVVMMCGPGAMVSAVADALFDIGLPMENVVYEQFDYAAASTARKDRLHAAQYASLGAALGLAALVFAFL